MSSLLYLQSSVEPLLDSACVGEQLDVGSFRNMGSVCRRLRSADGWPMLRASILSRGKRTMEATYRVTSEWFVYDVRFYFFDHQVHLKETMSLSKLLRLSDYNAVSAIRPNVETPDEPDMIHV